MAVDFPCKLPAPLVSSNSVNPQSSVRLHQTAGGAPIVEKFSSDTWTSQSVAWSFDELQYQVFSSWFNWSAKDGAETINMPLKNHLGLTTKEVIMSTFSAVQSGRRWIVSAQVIVVRKEKMEECYAESLVNAYDGFESLPGNMILLSQAVGNLP